MNAVETVHAVLAAIEASDWERARSQLADTFTFSGAVPEPISPDAWLGIHRAFAAAMPDFSFNASDLREEESRVFGQVQLTGTQTRELALPLPGFAPLPPTGKRVSLPAEGFTATLRDGRLVNYEVARVTGGGLPGILAQLGATIPLHAQASAASNGDVR
jgi:predicted ester cyclase